MKKYTNFLLENISQKQNKYIELVINYLLKNTNYEFFPYEEEFQVKKNNSDEILTGKLFLIPDERAIRLNFNKRKLVSIDLWDNFEFLTLNKIYNKPTYQMNISDSIMGVLDDIVDFVEEEFELYELNEHEPTIKKSPDEETELKTFKINKNVFEQDMDSFEAVKLYTAQVAYKVSNSLVVSGSAGMGKTTDIMNTLKDMRVDYIDVSGDITTAGLYDILFKNRDKLIVFDDMDSVYKSEESVNLLKAVLDTQPIRKVSRILKINFDSFGMSDQKIQEIYDETGKLPKQFEFTGRIIFITNKPGEELDEALISRSLFVDINPSIDEVINRIKKIMPKIKPNIKIGEKNDILDFMIGMHKEYDLRFALNLRTFVHCLNIKLSNAFEMTIKGKKIPAWQMLVKNFLVKK